MKPHCVELYKTYEHSVIFSNQTLPSEEPHHMNVFMLLPDAESGRISEQETGLNTKTMSTEY